MKVFSVILYVLAVSFLLNAISGQWAFDFGDRGAGWIALDCVIAAACGAAAFGLWRRATRAETPLWRRIANAWTDGHAVHVFLTTGRLLGLSGAVLLAVAVTAAHRWSQLPENWGRALPFGILALVFLGAGTSPVVRRWVLPSLGVVASVLITLPFGSSAHGAWDMFGAAISLLAFGGVMLAVALAAVTGTGAHPVRARLFPVTLGGVAVGYSAFCFLILHGAALRLVGWWALGVLASGVLATAWETLVIARFVSWAGARQRQAAAGADTPATTATAASGTSLAPGQEPEQAS